MSISDWSSDVCSSDLCSIFAILLGRIPGDRYRSVSATQPILGAGGPADGRPTMTKAVHCDGDRSCFDVLEGLGQFGRAFGIFGAETADFDFKRQQPCELERVIAACFDFGDRKSVVLGTRVSVRVDLGGRRIITKNKQKR